MASYEQLFLDAVRGRYARLYGLALLPEMDKGSTFVTTRSAADQCPHRAAQGCLAHG